MKRKFTIDPVKEDSKIRISSLANHLECEYAMRAVVKPAQSSLSSLVLLRIETSSRKRDTSTETMLRRRKAVSILQ